MSSVASSKFDVAVVGSGGAGLLAACAAADSGLSVIVFEADELLGGTTALSGGQMWVPCSAPMDRAGLIDSTGAARSYLQRVSLGATHDEILESFLSNGPGMVEYLENDLNVPLLSVERADYHPDWPGAGFGRSLEPLPVSTEGLGEWRERMRLSPVRRPATGPESRRGISGETLKQREAAGIRTQGSGLIAGLVGAALRRNVQLTTGSKVTSAVRQDADWYSLGVDGRNSTEILAHNLVLAAGGFARNTALRHDFLPLVDIVPTGAPGSAGSGMMLGTSLGGHLSGMSEAWWTAAISIPGESIEGADFHRNVVRELAYPGSILVNRAGKRFVNEASSYNDLGKAFFDFDASSHLFPNSHSWLIFDAQFKNSRNIAGITPSHDPPEWMMSAPDIETLASRAGITHSGLSLTVSAFNTYAREGTDPEFGRGANAHDRFNGDPEHQPNPCLGPIIEAPFFAVPVGLGANGTKGGLAVDAYSRVLDNGGNPIAGLFAVGESAAALMGPGYAGAGASLGPALTAAYTLSRKLNPHPTNRRHHGSAQATNATRS